jgi:hypothetical protein
VTTNLFQSTARAGACTSALARCFAKATQYGGEGGRNFVLGVQCYLAVLDRGRDAAEPDGSSGLGAEVLKLLWQRCQPACWARQPDRSY